MVNYKGKYRQYKIAKVLDKEFNDKDFIEFHNLIKDKVSNLKKFNYGKCENYTYYGKSSNDEDLYIKYNNKENYLIISYEAFWRIVENHYRNKWCELEDIKMSIKDAIEEHLDLNKTVKYMFDIESDYFLPKELNII